jgi:molybdopterin-dependent oxidoreductase alpha subunit
MARDPEAPRAAGLKLAPYAGPAAGAPAVWSGLKYAHRHAGLTRGTRALLRVNQPEGFDCPGCAWPDPLRRATAEFCENGARAVAHEATTRTVTPLFFQEWTLKKLRAQSDLWLEAQGRLTHPVVKRPGAARYEALSWDEAFDLVAEKLRSLKTPDEAAFYTSGRTSNEAAFLYQLFARQLGTNNLPDCSNMCHESSGVGMSKVIGVGKGTVSLEDFDHADLILVLGQNPGTNHPRMLTTLEECARRGAKIISVNPLKERALERFAHPQTARGLLGGGTAISSQYVQVRIGGDIAFLKGVMKRVLALEEERPGQVLDHAFLAAHCTGYEAFKASLDEVSWGEVVEHSGVSREEIEQVGEAYASARRVIACWAMGLTQHKFGVANVREVVNLLLLRGNLGREGAGACPVRGHSNVQGDRTMGISEAPAEAFLARLGEACGFSPPRAHGYDVWGTLQAMAEGRVKVFFSLGGNFAAATPDTAGTAAGLARCELTVQVSTKLNRSHLEVGQTALILPCLGRTERDVQEGGVQFVTVENSMSVVHRSQGRLEPAGEALKSEPWIVCQLAARTLGEGSVTPWSQLAGDYDKVRALIERSIAGFERYNERVRAKDGFVLANTARVRQWSTASGKAELTVQALPKIELGDGEFLLMTVRSHDQYNTTIYASDDRYRGVYGERRVILMNRTDLEEAGLHEGQRVHVTSHFRGELRRAEGFLVLPYDIPRRCLAAYFPEANVLVPRDQVADESRTPASKSVVVTLAPA